MLLSYPLIAINFHRGYLKAARLKIEVVVFVDILYVGFLVITFKSYFSRSYLGNETGPEFFMSF